jgi:hypothetical protein
MTYGIANGRAQSVPLRTERLDRLVGTIGFAVASSFACRDERRRQHAS